MIKILLLICDLRGHRLGAEDGMNYVNARILH